MRLFLSISDRIGFAALCISSALAASSLSLLRVTQRYSVAWLKAVGGEVAQAISKLPKVITTTRKGEMKWIVISVWKFKFLMGMK